MKLWSGFKTFINFVWFPVLLLTVFLLLAYKITSYHDPDTVKVALGIMLGVALGFVADILKRSLDEFSRERNLRRIALALLRNDAENVYRSVELYKSAMDAVDTAPPEARENIKLSLPPPFELRYWNRLNQSNNFLLLGTSEPFKSIFHDLWELEKINHQIGEALNQDKQAYGLAKVMYSDALNRRHHEKLLSHFLSSSELEKFKRSARPTFQK